jgi:hypothetical protein
MRKNAKSIEEIKEILKEHKEEVSRKYKVSEIGIYDQKVGFLCAGSTET